MHTDDINKASIPDAIFASNESNEPYGLIERYKGEKLSKEQLIFLRKEIDSKRYSVKDVSIKYGVSPSIIRNIKKMSSNISENLPIRKYDKICEYQRDSIKHNIIQYYVKVKSVFTSADVQKYLHEKCNIICSLKIIRDIMKRDIMKRDLDFTYKNCRTRSNVVDFSKVKALRVLFSVNLSKQLKERI